MPELPEVENVRLGLAESVVGRSVTKVTLRRRDIVQGPCKPTDLLYGRAVVRIDRLGKQLALVGAASINGSRLRTEPCICVHLGMTGSLRYYPVAERYIADKHTHVVWHLDAGDRLVFRDPRRFGGLWTFASTDNLRLARWAQLGEDALTIKPTRLYAQLNHSRRPIKSALLDQSVVAGLGNIYVDELLFTCRVSPLRTACDLNPGEVRMLVGHMRRLLRRAIRSGGSTLRDYVDAGGRSGAFQLRHQVYGRSGRKCQRCRHQLHTAAVSGRTTVFCPTCQH